MPQFLEELVCCPKSFQQLQPNDQITSSFLQSAKTAFTKSNPTIFSASCITFCNYKNICHKRSMVRRRRRIYQSFVSSSDCYRSWTLMFIKVRLDSRYFILYLFRLHLKNATECEFNSIHERRTSIRILEKIINERIL